MVRALSTLLISTAMVCAVGCGGGSGFDVAPVSGTVTMDGAPLAGATVTFLPQASAGSEAGPASIGETDAEGKFTLKTASGEKGAVVAHHQVRITTVKNDATSTTDDNVYAKSEPEKIPSIYNTATKLSFDVPASGSTAADFPLESNPKQ